LLRFPHTTAPSKRFEFYLITKTFFVRFDSKKEEKTKGREMGTTTKSDDAMRIHNEELKANVAKMDAFLDAMEKAIVDANEDEDTDDKKFTSSSSTSSKMVSLQKAEKLLERTRLGLLAFAVLLKTNGVNSDEHEGLRLERKRVEAYSRKIEETKKRITKKNEEEEEKEEVGEIKEESRKNNNRHREDGEIPRANGRVASRFVFNALGGSKTAEKNRLKQEAQAKLRRSIEEDVKSKFEERVNERYREKDKSRGTGEKQKTKKKKTNDHAEPEIEDGEYSD
jgi:hypothetical protein